MNGKPTTIMDVVLSDSWHRLMRLPKGVILLTCARDANKRIELQLMATQEDWARWQRLDKQQPIDIIWVERKALSSDLTVGEILDLIEADRAERKATALPP